MKRLTLIILLVCIGAGFAGAGSQWDITINVPYYLQARDASGDFGNIASYAFVLPEVKWNYFFGPEWLHFGLGLRLWTIIVETALYPIISLESNLGNFVLNANVGGGAFVLFGLYSNFAFEGVILPEFSVAYRLGKKKIFSLGAGTLFMFSLGDTQLPDSTFMATAFARWTF